MGRLAKSEVPKKEPKTTKPQTSKVDSDCGCGGKK